MEHFVQVFVALLAITDPTGAVPVFMGLTARMSPEARRRAPRDASLFAGIILMLALVAGEMLLKFFGVSLAAFQAAGGLLLVLMGLEMLQGTPTKVQDESQIDEESEDRIWVPLAMPLLAGPGSIATVITFTVRAHGWRETFEIAGAIILVVVIVYLTLRSSNWLQRRLSKRGQRILIRFMGLILVAIGAQLLLAGVQAFGIGTPKP